MQHGQIVTILRGAPGGRDEYDDPIESAVERRDVQSLGVAPRTSDESRANGRNGVVVGLLLYLPPGTDITYTDRVEISGVVYEVEGIPGSWSNPLTGTAFGLQVALNRAQG